MWTAVNRGKAVYTHKKNEAISTVRHPKPAGKLRIGILDIVLAGKRRKA